MKGNVNFLDIEFLFWFKNLKEMKK